jgi:hypothetical protein
MDNMRHMLIIDTYIVNKAEIIYINRDFRNKDAFKHLTDPCSISSCSDGSMVKLIIFLP